MNILLKVSKSAWMKVVAKILGRAVKQSVINSNQAETLTKMFKEHEE